MNIWRKSRKPRGVKLHTSDGRQISHSLVRRPDRDAGGIEKWEIVPVQPLFSADFPVHLAVRKLPGKTKVFMERTVTMQDDATGSPPETYMQ